MPAQTTLPEPFSAIPALLSRLRTASGRETLPDAPDHRLEQVLRNISETVLPRRLTFQCGNKTLGTLTVSNRRLVGADCHEDLQQEPSDLGETAVLAQVLRSICETETSLGFSASGRPGDLPDPDSGYSVRSLRRALGGKHSPCPVAVMTDLIETDTAARIHWNDHEESGVFSGDVTHRETLENLFLCHMAEKPARGHTGIEGALLPVKSDQTVLVVEHDATGIAAIMPTELAISAMQSWQQMLSTRSD